MWRYPKNPVWMYGAHMTSALTYGNRNSTSLDTFTPSHSNMMNAKGRMGSGFDKDSVQMGTMPLKPLYFVFASGLCFP